MRCIDEKLFRDATDIDASPPEVALFCDRHLGAIGCGDAARADAAGTGSDSE
jgi:hypothetical protein